MSPQTPTEIGHVHAVLRGPAVPCQRPDGRPGGLSAIAKQPVVGPVHVGLQGLEGDTQGDRRVHGGPDKAVHQYPLEHYPAWRGDLGAHPVLDAPGAFGENLATTGLTEATACWGDRVRIGTVVLELAQSRQPCWKLNLRFGRPDMARRLQDTGRTGWYWRVLEEGTLQFGDAIHLLERPHPQWPLARVIGALYHHALDADLLRGLAQLPLPPSWQRIVQGRLERGQVEDWRPRMEG